MTKIQESKAGRRKAGKGSSVKKAASKVADKAKSAVKKAVKS
jgi:hypothetical protein